MTQTVSHLKKDELIAEASRLSGQPMTVVREVLDAAADATRDALKMGRDVFILGLGKLALSQRGERKARNIHTGEAVTVPPRTVVLFRPSESVVAAANDKA